MDVVAVTSEPKVTPAATAGTRFRAPLLALVALEIVALYAPTAAWLYDRWTMSVWNNIHGLFIPPLVAYFAWMELRRVGPIEERGSAWGFVFLAPALLMHVLDTGIGTQILSAMSIVVALPGLSLLFLGPVRTRAIAFPLAFSLFMLPIPLAMTERIHLVLRHLTTAGAAAVLPWLGITVFSEGTTLHLSQGTLLVGTGCSGFSTLYASLAVAALAAYGCNYWRGRIVTMVSAAPLAAISNVFRVVLLALMVDWRGTDVLETWIHPASGILTFFIALPIILWLGAPRQPLTRASV